MGSGLTERLDLAPNYGGNPRSRAGLSGDLPEMFQNAWVVEVGAGGTDS